MPVFVRVLCLMLLFHLTVWTTARGDEPPSPAAAMLKLIRDGRVPAQRLPTIVKLVCERGNSADLEFIFSQAAREGGWPPELRRETLDWLLAAARNRKVHPAGDTSALLGLIRSDNRNIRDLAIELAGEWKVQSAQPLLLELARAADTPQALRQLVLQSLAQLDPTQTLDLLVALSAANEPFSLRAMAVCAMAELDVQRAAATAASILQQATDRDDPAPIVDAFLNLNRGSAVLAAEIQKVTLHKDVARLMLRHMYALGRTDAELNRVLSDLAGMAQSSPPPTKSEIAALVQEAAEQGDPVRGETVFRRKDLSCMNCHAVSGGGGQIGPDLSAIGASSPVDYLATSVLDPDQAIKEAYITRLVVTVDGKIVQGIVANRTADALVLKDATGKLVSVPVADIEHEAEGKSLMPKGLVNFMTHAELVDLVAFLSRLGKPGEFAIRGTQRMQRYRLLTQVPTSLLTHVPSLSDYEDLVWHSHNWQPVYARVNGELPLDELTKNGTDQVIYVRGDVNCSAGGEAEIHLDSAEGVTAWLDDQELGSRPSAEVHLTPGEHAIVLRIDRQRRPAGVIRLEVARPAGSPAQFVVVDGQ